MLLSHFKVKILNEKKPERIENKLKYLYVSGNWQKEFRDKNVFELETSDRNEDPRGTAKAVKPDELRVRSAELTDKALFPSDFYLSAQTVGRPPSRVLVSRKNCFVAVCHVPPALRAGEMKDVLEMQVGVRSLRLFSPTPGATTHLQSGVIELFNPEDAQKLILMLDCLCWPTASRSASPALAIRAFMDEDGSFSAFFEKRLLDQWKVKATSSMPMTSAVMYTPISNSLLTVFAFLQQKKVAERQSNPTPTISTPGASALTSTSTSATSNTIWSIYAGSYLS